MPAIAVQLNLWGAAVRGESTMVSYADPQERAARGGVAAPAEAPRATHCHSLAAHDRHQDAHRGRKQLILECLQVRGKPLTDRQIRDLICPGGDMNAVRPRITELLRDGRLIEAGEIEDPDSHETVRVVWLA